MNECMLHRDTGINRLAGIDKNTVPITLVALEDCTYGGNSISLSDSLFKLAMLYYYKQF